MIRFAIFALALASPATAAKVAFDPGPLTTWGKHLSLSGQGGYKVTAEGRDQRMDDDSTLVAAFGFFNDRTMCVIRCGQARSFTGSIFDGETTVSWGISAIIRQNPALDSWSMWVQSDDPAVEYRMDFGVLTGGTGDVQEVAWDYTYVYRLPVAWVEPEQPAPVPLPGAGWLLACGLGALALRRAGK